MGQGVDVDSSGGTRGHSDPDAGPPGTHPIVLMLAALPAVLIGLGLRAWSMRTPLLPLNADEAVTGLQSYEVLHGHFRLVVAGNQYGATSESYLFAPLLAVWSGPIPLRIGSILLSAVAAWTIYLLGREFFTRAVSLTLALIGWTMSGAVVVLWTRPYMGYTTGFIAEVVALVAATRAMNADGRRLGRLGLIAGVGTGLALWSHPMFGIVSMLMLLAPTVRHVRDLLHWWLPAAGGFVLGIAPWLLFIARNGLPGGPGFDSTYSERLVNFFADLLPRLLGVRAPDGGWPYGAVIGVLFLAAVLASMVVGYVALVRRCGPKIAPALTAAVLTFPVLSAMSAFTFHQDARYGMAYIPPLLVGLGGLSLLATRRVQQSAALVAVVPTVWALALCVPVIHYQVGFTFTNPDQGAEEATAVLERAGVTDLGGEYWATYLVDYLADGRFDVRPDVAVRFNDDAARFDASTPTDRTYIYTTGIEPHLALPPDDYQLVQVGGYDIYLPDAG